VCPDNIGRFNHFRAVQLPGRPESSIYFSPATGPHDIFGAIRDKWASMGFERSVLGYPVGSEHDQKGGGRTQRFERGVTTWTNTGGPAEHEVSGDVVKFDSGQVNSDLAMNGNVQLVVKRDGSFSLTTHVHDSGFSNISYGLSVVLVTSAGDGFTFQHSGHIQGTSGNPFGPQRNDDFFNTGQNPAIAAKWDNIVESGRLLVNLTGEDKLASALTDLLAEAAKQAAQAGVKALVAVIAG
jgi:uncharacterized protein with LGFP repeats